MTYKEGNMSGAINILVKNAAVTRDNLVLRMSEADWDTVLDTNLKSAYLCSKAGFLHTLAARSITKHILRYDGGVSL